MRIRGIAGIALSALVACAPEDTSDGGATAIGGGGGTGGSNQGAALGTSGGAVGVQSVGGAPSGTGGIGVPSSGGAAQVAIGGSLLGSGGAVATTGGAQATGGSTGGTATSTTGGSSESTGGSGGSSSCLEGIDSGDLCSRMFDAAPCELLDRSCQCAAGVWSCVVVGVGGGGEGGNSGATGGVGAGTGGGTSAVGGTVGNDGGTSGDTGGTSGDTGGTAGVSGSAGDTAIGGSDLDCPTPAVQAVSSLQTISELPDPFEFMDGTRMRSPEDWPCRRAELSALIQAFEYGEYPPVPDSVTGTLSGSTLTVQVSRGGTSISFSVTVTLPSGSGPFPVYVGLGGAGFGAPFAASQLTSRGIAHISYTTDDMATDAAGRGGKFYQLYGSSTTAGVLMAWAWGIHRIVDAMEQIDSLDETRVAVHGFSRWGKGALVTGAFDERIALTIASSSGAGGIGSWRASDRASGSVQTLSQINDEAPHWFTAQLKSSFVGHTTLLPFDGHSVAALVAPRALLVTEGSADSWNTPVGCYQAARAAEILFDYVSPDHFGFASGNHSHAFEESATALAFMDRFLLGQDAETDVFQNPGNFSVGATEIPWSAP